MKIIRTDIPDVLIIKPQVFGDQRGFFFESFNERAWQRLIGHKPCFVQNNHSRSTKGVLRGLHYQIKQPQAKLIRVVVGEIFDVAVDIRKNSPTFGKWEGTRLSAENKLQMWVPSGFAHGFLVLSEAAEVLYMTTDFYAPQYERNIVWNDPDLNIKWPIDGAPILSEKDSAAPFFKDAEYPADNNISIKEK